MEDIRQALIGFLQLALHRNVHFGTDNFHIIQEDLGKDLDTSWAGIILNAK